jgi:hypothetical protein
MAYFLSDQYERAESAIRKMLNFVLKDDRLDVFRTC